VNRNRILLAEFVLALLVAWPSMARPACPGPQTYFFSGRGDVVLRLSATSAALCDAGAVYNGDYTTSNGVSCLPGCPTTATATGSVTEVIKSGTCNNPNATYDGISCDEIVSITIKADCTFEKPFSPSENPTRTLNNITVRSSKPTPVLSDPFKATPADVCTSFVGSTLDTVSYMSVNEEAFDAVATHGAGCRTATAPCPTTSRVEQFTPALDFEGHSVLNSTAP
jgi:hypothetical protein